jgi:hypothetical protein
MIRIAFAIAAALLALAPRALAQKPSVDVTFKIADGHLYDEFRAENEAAIAAKVARDAAALLGTAFPLFDLQTRPAANHLQITLEDRRADAGVQPAVVLTLRMKAKAVVDGESFLRESAPYQVMFRTDEERGEPAGSPEAFAAEVIAAVARAVNGNSADFVANVLEPINLMTSEAFAVPQQRAFVMPFTAKEYLIGRGSRFRVTAMNSSSQAFTVEAQAGGAARGIANLPARFQEKLSLTADRPENILAKLVAERLKADGVHLLRYDRLIPDDAPIPPSALNTGNSR